MYMKISSKILANQIPQHIQKFYIEILQDAPWDVRMFPHTNLKKKKILLNALTERRIEIAVFCYKTPIQENRQKTL